MQAQDTFVAELEDGSTKFVAKGEVFADAHELVKRDQAGTGQLFRRLDLGEEQDAEAAARSKAEVARGTTAEGAPGGEPPKSEETEAAAPGGGEPEVTAGTAAPARTTAAKSRSGRAAGKS